VNPSATAGQVSSKAGMVYGLGADQDGFDPKPLETQHFWLHAALYFSLRCGPDLGSPRVKPLLKAR